MFSSSMACQLYTLPVVFTATMWEESVNALFSTGQAYSPSLFLWKVSRVSCFSSRGSPVSGCLWCFLTNGTMFNTSKQAPSSVHTGSSAHREKRGW